VAVNNQGTRKGTRHYASTQQKCHNQRQRKNTKFPGIVYSSAYMLHHVEYLMRK